jgi:hypothetical protein
MTLDSRERLGRCAEQLRNAVFYLAVNPGEPKNKLRSLMLETSFGSIDENEFPDGNLKEDFQMIMRQLRTKGPSINESILAMSAEDSRDLILQICELSENVAHTLALT